MTTLCLVGMCGLIGLVTDLGWDRFVGQQAQAAADSAVVAGAEFVLKSAGQTGAITCGTTITCQAETGCPATLTSPPANSFQAACLYAVSNGFSNTGNQKVTVASGISSSAPTAAGVQVSYWITVRASQTVPQFFSAVLGNTMATVAARASGAIVGDAGAPCLYALAPTGKDAFKAAGGAVVNVACGIDVNSNDSSGMRALGNSCVTATAIRVAGNYSGNCFSPIPTTGVAPAADPYASSPAAPTFSGCDYTGVHINSNQTIYPGVYCGGIQITGGTVTVSPGTYILDGGGLSVSSANTVITGAGVTFYLTSDKNNPSGDVKITGQASVTLSAPASGPLAGMLFFQDRSISGGKSQFAGGANLLLTGILYLPGSEVDFSGGSTVNETYMAIVANTLNFTGNTYFKNYNELKNPLVVRSAAVVE